jgi:hypothetical protein
MKIKLLSFVVLVCCFGCSKSDDLLSNEIAYGNCKSFPAKDLEICFISLNEYRCPCNADCVWEGSADAGLRIKTQNGIDTTVVLTEIKSLEKYTAVVGGHTIKLEKVEVADFCNDYGKASKYKVLVEID